MQSQFPRGSRSSVIPLLLCIYIRIWFKPPPLRTYTELKINNYKTENQQLQKQIFRLARGRRNSTTTISLQTYNICADNIIYADSSIVYQYHNFIATPVNCEHRQLSRKSPPSHPLSQNVHPTHGDKKKNLCIDVPISGQIDTLKTPVLNMYVSYSYASIKGYSVVSKKSCLE